MHAFFLSISNMYAGEKNNLIYILWQYPCKTLSYDINDLEKNLPHVKNNFSYEYACVCISDLFLPLSEVGIIQYLKRKQIYLDLSPVT